MMMMIQFLRFRLKAVDLEFNERPKHVIIEYYTVMLTVTLLLYFNIIVVQQTQNTILKVLFAKTGQVLWME